MPRCGQRSEDWIARIQLLSSNFVINNYCINNDNIVISYNIRNKLNDFFFFIFTSI